MKRKITVITFLLLGIAGLTAFFILYNRENFTGNIVRDDYSYILDIEQMNGTDCHALQLTTGDTLEVRFITEKGSLTMEIKAPDGTQLYAGNGNGTTDFTLNITENGTYTVAVEARHAKGTIYIKSREKTQ